MPQRPGDLVELTPSSTIGMEAVEGGWGRWYTSVCCNENDSRSSETILTINLMTGVFVVLELAICSSSVVSRELVERN